MIRYQLKAKSEREREKRRQTSQHGYKQIVAAHKQSEQIYTMTAQLFQFHTHTCSLSQTAFSAVRLQAVQQNQRQTGLCLELVSKMANNKIARQM